MRWGIVFLACPLQLSEDQRRDLMLAAVRAHHDGVEETPLNVEGIRGALRVLPESVALGGLSGRLFEAEVATPDAQEGLLRFLVAEKELRLMQGGPVAEA